MSRRKRKQNKQGSSIKEQEIKTIDAKIKAADARPKQRSKAFGILAITIACINLVTILTTYRGIKILLPAPFVFGIISIILAKHDKNEAGLVYGIISILFYTALALSMFMMFLLTQLANK